MLIPDDMAWAQILVLYVIVGGTVLELVSDVERHSWASRLRGLLFWTFYLAGLAIAASLSRQLSTTFDLKPLFTIDLRFLANSDNHCELRFSGLRRYSVSALLAEFSLLLVPSPSAHCSFSMAIPLRTSRDRRTKCRKFRPPYYRGDIQASIYHRAIKFLISTSSPAGPRHFGFSKNLVNIDPRQFAGFSRSPRLRVCKATLSSNSSFDACFAP